MLKDIDKKIAKNFDKNIYKSFTLFRVVTNTHLITRLPRTSVETQTPKTYLDKDKKK